ncbi:MAG: FixH family protein [Chloroflexota bacterium]
MAASKHLPTSTTRRTGRPLWWLLILVLALVLTTGCRRESRQTSDDGLSIELMTPLFDPEAGRNFVDIRILDPAGSLVSDATLHLRGDMTHAGMVPVFAESAGAQGDFYRVPFEWTMTGDWVLTVDAELGDGRQASRQFDISVTEDGVYCMENE